MRHHKSLNVYLYRGCLFVCVCVCVCVCVFAFMFGFYYTIVTIILNVTHI